MAYTETVAAGLFNEIGINTTTGAERFSVDNISIRRV